MTREPSADRERARSRLPPVLLLSAALVAAALAAGLRGEAGWLLELTLLVAVAQGVAGGLAFPFFWQEGIGPEGRPPGRGEEQGGRAASSGGAPPIVRVLLGVGGRYAAFLASVAFAAVEAHAVGSGLARGAPLAALTLLVPPVVVGAILLRGALARLPGESRDQREGRSR